MTISAEALIADIYSFYSGQSLLHNGLRVVLRVGQRGIGGMRVVVVCRIGRRVVGVCRV